MKKLYFLVILFFVIDILKAQENYGPRINAMGNAGVALSDVWSASNNQAGLAGFSKPIISAGYENRFTVKELSTKSAVVALPIKGFVVGASFQSYGVSAYQEVKSGVSLAKAFGPKLFLALGVNYHQLNIESYGNANALSVELGVQYQALPKLWLASHIANPNQSKFGKNSEQVIPAHIKFGASYILSDQLLLSSEVEKILDAQADFKAGLEYKIIKLVALRGGISVNPFKQFVGFGIDYQNLNVDFSVASHPVLGYSPQISLGYEF